FSAPARPRVFAAWHRLLRPGGTLIFTNRVRPHASAAPVGFDAEQARQFVEVVRGEAERRQATLGLDPAEAARRAETYAGHYRTYPLQSVDEVRRLLDDGGFSIDVLDGAIHPGREDGAGVSGPTTAERAEYVRAIATRRSRPPHAGVPGPGPPPPGARGGPGAQGPRPADGGGRPDQVPERARLPPARSPNGGDGSRPAPGRGRAPARRRARLRPAA